MTSIDNLPDEIREYIKDKNISEFTINDKINGYKIQSKIRIIKTKNKHKVDKIDKPVIGGIDKIDKPVIKEIDKIDKSLFDKQGNKLTEKQLKRREVNRRFYLKNKKK